MGKPVQKRRKRSPGRPTKFTLDVRTVICQAIQLGATDEQAAEEAGIARATLSGWLTKGADGKPGYAEFLDDVERARARRPDAVLCRLPGYDDWRADDAYLKSLERRGERSVRLRRMQAEADKAEAEARIIQAKADAAEAAVNEGGGMLVLFGDLLETLPDHVRAPLLAYLADRGHSAVSTPLAPSAPDPKLLERVTPTPAAREP